MQTREQHVDTGEFGAKVNRVLSDLHYRKSAKRVSDSMRQFGGTETAAIRIEEFIGSRQGKRRKVN